MGQVNAAENFGSDLAKNAKSALILPMIGSRLQRI